MSIAGVLATAAVGFTASSAAAADVWMWACHGPGGQGLGALPFSDQATGGQVSDLNGGCAANGLQAGKRLTAPAANSSAELTLRVDQSFNVSRVRVVRQAAGLTAEGAPTYTLTWNGKPLADNGAAVDPEFDISPNSAGPSELKIRLECGTGCTSGAAATLDLLRVGFLVRDSGGPYSAGASRQNPVVVSTQPPAGDPTREWVIPDTPWSLSASDDAAGLASARVEIFAADGVTKLLENVIDYGCTDLSPGASSIDRPLDRAKCPLSVDTKVTPQFRSLYNSNWMLPHTLALKRTVTFTDAAGHEPVAAFRNEDFEVVYLARPESQRTLSIGTTGIVVPSPGTPPGGGAGGGGGGGVLPGNRSSCRTPRLSVVLAGKPVRISKGVPVLRYKRAYRFKGRLTCVVNGKRRSAPKRTKIAIYNKVGKRTVRKGNTAIRSGGAVSVTLKLRSSRTLIFRYTNADRQRSEVKIKVRITKKKS